MIFFKELLYCSQPTLFIIHINQINDFNTNGRLVFYVDNTVLFVKGQSKSIIHYTKYWFDKYPKITCILVKKKKKTFYYIL